MKQLHLNTCRKCGKEFRTDNPIAPLCPTCEKQIKAKKKAKSKPKQVLSLSQVCKIIRIYNAVNRTNYHYGNMVLMIDRTEAGRCICCNEKIEKGVVCRKCIYKAKKIEEERGRT